MEPNLRPLSLSEILDRTAQMYRAHFLVYLGIAAIPSVTLLVFAALAFLLLGWVGSAAADVAAQSTQMMVAGVGLLLLGLVALPVWLLTSSLGWAALSHAAARAFLGGAIGIRDQYRAVWPRGWRYIGLVLLLGLILTAVPAVALVAGAVGLGVGLGGPAGGGDAAAFARVAVYFLLISAAVAFSFWMLLRLALVFPSAVVEDLRPWKAIKRASGLSRGTRGRIFVLFLLGAALSWILALSALVPASLLLALIPGAGSVRHAELVGRILIFSWYAFSFAVQAVVRPVYGIALTLFYFDQRIRNEGFDIEWMMRAAGLEAATGPAIAPTASAEGDMA